MTISIAIKTKDRRPRKNFLSETLSNLNRAGIWDSPHLHSLHIVDSGTGDGKVMDFLRAEALSMLPSDRNVTIHTAPIDKPRTLHQNAAMAIRVAAKTNARWALVLEDDLDFCGQFLESIIAWIMDHRKPTDRMIVLGANYAQIGQAVLHGDFSWKYPIKAFYGAQALLWRREDAEQLADWLGEDPNYNGHTNHGHDLLLQKWGENLNLPHFTATAPSFVQHIGRESGIDNRFFQFQSWPGPEWTYRSRVRV